MGPSGGRLSYWWRKNGMSRDDFYITNVVPYQPDHIDKVPREEMEGHIAALKDRLRKLPEATLIVPTGNYALYGLTGKGKVSWHHKDGRHERPGIMDWRGSVMSVDLDGREVKVIPTIHPAAVLRDPNLERRSLHDWKRISEDKEFPELRLPKREHFISPTIQDVRDYVAKLHDDNLPVSIDIETPRKWIIECAIQTGELWGHTPKGKRKLIPVIEYLQGIKRGDPRIVRFKSGKKKGEAKTKSTMGPSYLGCVGYGNAIDFSMTVPTTIEYWRDEAKLAEVHELLDSVHTSRLPKVMQNGMFDSTYLRWHGWGLDHWEWDTRAMHHALDCRDDHDLAYMASIYTRQPFWKHESKDPDEVMKYASNKEALWTYNGIDVCVTLELYYYLLAWLEREGMVEFYLRHYADMIPALLDMSLHGVAINDPLRAEKLAQIDKESLLLGQKLEEACGERVLGDDGPNISNTKLAHYLYTTLKLPPQHKKGKFGEKRITTDEIAVRRLLMRFPQKLSVTGPMILDHRRLRKQAEFLMPNKTDADLRMRCQYSFVTEAGRLATHDTAWSTGRNLQNIDRELRYVFIPD